MPQTASPVLIRPVEPQDFNAWLKLWLGYQAFYKVEIAPAVTESTWARLLDPTEPMHCAVAVEGNQLIGLVHYIYHRSTWTAGPYCYLQDLFVDPALRAKGTGRRLIRHVYESAAAAGASRVYWLTHETNHDAMKLYDQVAERSGFLQYRHLLP
ncbi:GNAT family N-acetyltransferase [Xylophilus sp. GOD-11R]|uniref:GNAT family N-acetyltransferase n=1 Tax=Xylophilus sp. GOD-11R TaxID=3089814 RepID=UPI00298D22D6|nr:GNAT family N-acetyltransferase [Xylophilus sp. GOD-11R]WPB55164.1 GNAT family N-acetyltransferase [Xylophilus sp. GOD-11R]